jgi:5-methylcytosine-specific restriction endonuclease McrA
MDVGSVLVLNQNYEPLSVCNVRRAVILVLRGKAEIVEAARGRYTEHNVPPSSVIGSFTSAAPAQRCGSRARIFARDGWTCVCGRPARLTLDHVVPRHRGGTPGRTGVGVQGVQPPHEAHPAEARVTLRRASQPRVSIYHVFQYLQHQRWRKFMPGYEAASAAG